MAVSNVSGSSIAANSYGATRKGISGLASGMDTDSIIEGMVAGTQSKIDKQYQSIQKLEWQRDAYRSITNKILSFGNTFVNSGATKNIFNSSFFDKYTITARGTNASKVSASGYSSSVSSLQIHSVSQMARNASLISNPQAAADGITTNKLNIKDGNIEINNLAGQAFVIQDGDKSYTVKISDEFRGTSGEDIAAEINQQLAEQTGDASKLKINYDSANQKFSFTGDLADSAKLTKVSDKIKDALGLEAKTDKTIGELSGAFDSTKVKSTPSLKDTLTDKYMTFSLDGVERKITFKESDFVDDAGNSKVNNLNDLKDVIQKKLDNAFGKDRIIVKSDTTDGNIGNLSFNTSEPSSVVKFAGADSEVFSTFGMKIGESNRLVLGKSFADNFNLTPDMYDSNGNITMHINDEAFTFNKDDSVIDIMQKINDSDAGIKVEYLETTNRLVVSSTINGAAGRIDIGEKDGSGYKRSAFEELFFGANSAVTPGQDAKMVISYGDGNYQEITRGTNNFDIDGLQVTVSETFNDTFKADSSGNITGPAPDGAITFSSQTNSDDIIAGIKEMVTAYNEIVELVNKEVNTKPDRDYAPLTDAQKEAMTEKEIEKWETKAKTGSLFGDSMLQSLATEMRFIFSIGLGGEGSFADIGISTSESYKDNGKITLDEDKLRQALQEEPEKVKKMFTTVGAAADKKDGDTFNYNSGIADRLKSVFSKYATNEFSTKGLLIEKAGLEDHYTEATSTMYKQMKDINDYIKDLKNKLQIERDRYYNQFTNLEKMISQMNSQSAWLSQQLGTS